MSNSSLYNRNYHEFLNGSSKFPVLLELSEEEQEYNGPYRFYYICEEAVIGAEYKTGRGYLRMVLPSAVNCNIRHAPRIAQLLEKAHKLYKGDPANFPSAGTPPARRPLPKRVAAKKRPATATAPPTRTTTPANGKKPLKKRLRKR